MSFVFFNISFVWVLVVVSVVCHLFQFCTHYILLDFASVFNFSSTLFYVFCHYAGLMPFLLFCPLSSFCQFLLFFVVLSFVKIVTFYLAPCHLFLLLGFCHLLCCLLLFCHLLFCLLSFCLLLFCHFVFCYSVILISILYWRNAWTFSSEHLSLCPIRRWMLITLEKYLHLSMSLRFPQVWFLGKLLLKKGLTMKTKILFCCDYWIWSGSPVRRALNPLALTLPFETNLMVMNFFLDLKLLGLFLPQSQIWKYELIVWGCGCVGSNKLLDIAWVVSSYSNRSSSRGKKGISYDFTLLYLSIWSRNR